MTRLLHRMIEEASQRRPEATAIRCDGDSLSYGELLRQSAGLARFLRDRGLERQDRVAVLLDKGLTVPPAFYGTLGAGGALVPIDPKSPVSQITRILRATGATHLVTEPKWGHRLAEVLPHAPRLRHVLGLENTAAGLDVSPWSAVDALMDDQSLPDFGVNDLDTAYILHTSGSTGEPKLIRHTHASAMSFVDWAVQEYQLQPDDRLSNHSSHHTCFATFDLYAAARAGATTVLLRPAVLKMPGSLSALIERERLTVWYSVPTALVQLSLRGALETRDLSALRWVLFAGETFPEKHLRRLRAQLPEAHFSHVYGSTEVNVCTFYHLPDGEAPHPLPIGRACSNTVAEVVDEALQAVPDGEEGELLIRGATVMSGYWDDPEKNASIFVQRRADGGFVDTFFRTGDRVRRLQDGNLTFVARADLQIKVRGYRVELGEVESALLAVEGVEEAAAFAVPDGEGSLALQAVVVLAPNAVDLDLLEEMRRRLPIYAVPERLQILDSLPRTRTGKVDRKALQAQAGENIEQERPE